MSSGSAGSRMLADLWQSWIEASRSIDVSFS